MSLPPRSSDVTAVKNKALLLVVPVALAAWSVITHPWGWLYGLGVHPYPGPQTPWTYQMWSGIVPAMTVLSLFASLGGAYHLHNCHLPGCWRLGKVKVGGAPWCARHHYLAAPVKSLEDLVIDNGMIMEQIRQLLDERLAR